MPSSDNFEKYRPLIFMCPPHFTSGLFNISTPTGGAKVYKCYLRVYNFWEHAVVRNECNSRGNVQKTLSPECNQKAKHCIIQRNFGPGFRLNTPNATYNYNLLLR